eukprot:Polyplicarium_translucidae@DN3340_c0_g1_i13.p3
MLWGAPLERDACRVLWNALECFGPRSIIKSKRHALGHFQTDTPNRIPMLCLNRRLGEGGGTAQLLARTASAAACSSAWPPDGGHSLCSPRTVLRDSPSLRRIFDRP